MTEDATWHRVGPVRVAADEAIARGGELLASAAPDAPPTVAWWIVERDTLVLGRGSLVNADAGGCAEAGVAVIRRSSGGGPVLWGLDLLGLDIVIPRDHPLHRDDVVDAYKWPGTSVAAGLQRLGVPATALTPVEARQRNDPEAARMACFAGRSPWEVEAWGWKVGGLSQVRRKNATLIQVGIRLAADDGRLAALLDLSPPQRAHLQRALAAPAGAAPAWPERDAVIAAVEGAMNAS